MAFNYFGYGAFLECECDGENIIVHRNTGEVRKYPTRLGIALPKQKTKFISEDIMWYLEDESHTTFYVGRANGSVSGYRKLDNLLCRISSWKPPEQPILQDVGSAYDVISHRLVIDLSDLRTCYILGTNDEYVFNEKFNAIVNIPASIAACTQKIRGIYVIKSDGEEVDYGRLGRWIVEDISWCGDTKRLL